MTSVYPKQGARVYPDPGHLGTWASNCRCIAPLVEKIAAPCWNQREGARYLGGISCLIMKVCVDAMS